MGDVRDILRGAIMSQSHPAPADSWRWTEYKSEYRPFSQYSYNAGSWHRNAPLDATDGPSSWYAEVAERIQKAQEYKARSRSSGIGETDYPTERNRLIWSNSVFALTLHDTVDSNAGHRRQKSRFHSLGPTFPPSKERAAARSAVKSRTSRSVSSRRPESRDVPDTKTGAASPTKTVTKPQAAKPQTKKENDSKDAKTSKPRAVVKPTPAKEGDKVKEEKKWIKSAPSDTIDSKAKDNSKDAKPASEKISPKAVETTPAFAKTTTPGPKSTTTSTTAATPATAPNQATPVKATDSVTKPSNTTPNILPRSTKAGAQSQTPSPAEATETVKLSEVPQDPPAATQLLQTVSATSEPVQPQSKHALPDPVDKASDGKPSAMATPLIPSVAPTPVAPKSAPVDIMAQSFIDHSTIGGGNGVAKTAPKPADFSMARSRLDEFWAGGK